MKPKLDIRTANSLDFPEIMAIYDQVKLDRSKLNDITYVTKIQKEGFLLGTDNKQNYEDYLKNSTLFLVATTDNHIVGYIIADHREKFYDDEYKTWFNLKLKNIYYNDPKATSLAALAVDPKLASKGIATSLLLNLEEKLRNLGYAHLFSIITIAPVTNCPTITWHTKNGFQRIAMGRPREKLFDLEWYVGVLLYKNIAS